MFRKCNWLCFCFVLGVPEFLGRADHVIGPASGFGGGFERQSALRGKEAKTATCRKEE